MTWHGIKLQQINHYLGSWQSYNVRPNNARKSLNSTDKSKWWSENAKSYENWLQKSWETRGGNRLSYGRGWLDSSDWWVVRRLLRICCKMREFFQRKSRMRERCCQTIKLLKIRKKDRKKIRNHQCRLPFFLSFLKIGHAYMLTNIRVANIVAATVIQLVLVLVLVLV